MPPPPIFDLDILDFDHPLADHTEVLRSNPQRHEFELLDAVLFCDEQNGTFAGYHDVREDAWWVKAHIPARPLFPGVLAIEAAAQLSSYVMHRAFQHSGFVGLVGVDEVKFRGAIEPPCRYVVIGRTVEVRSRRIRCYTQGYVNGTMVFEAEIMGMTM
ncbi:MAG: beta-hydroxyacyl-ACP dehydratase [Phycisphaerae bacterium]|jgi:3-hydroxyacyl-[acyl-carrier-protein] dehydratase